MLLAPQRHLSLLCRAASCYGTLLGMLSAPRPHLPLKPFPPASHPPPAGQLVDGKYEHDRLYKAQRKADKDLRFKKEEDSMKKKRKRGGGKWKKKMNAVAGYAAGAVGGMLSVATGAVSGLLGTKGSGEVQEGEEEEEDEEGEEEDEDSSDDDDDEEDEEMEEGSEGGGEAGAPEIAEDATATYLRLPHDTVRFKVLGVGVGPVTQ